MNVNLTPLQKKVKETGFKFKKGLMELSNISVKRVEFLKSYIKENMEALYRFEFDDEIWNFQNGIISRSSSRSKVP